MKTNHFLTFVILTSLFFTNCTDPQPAPAESAPAAEAKATPADLAKRGEYLVHIMGCNDCHTPKIMTPQGPAPDPARMLSGHPAEEKLAAISDPRVLKNYALFNGSLTAAVGPWGTSFSANLTPDETGLGNWTLEMFGKALREGKLKGMEGTRPLLPPMPWQNYASLTDDDLAAIFAYLQSVPPVKNVAPAPLPPAAM